MARCIRSHSYAGHLAMSTCSVPLHEGQAMVLVSNGLAQKSTMLTNLSMAANHFNARGCSFFSLGFSNLLRVQHVYMQVVLSC